MTTAVVQPQSTIPWLTLQNVFTPPIVQSPPNTVPTPTSQVTHDPSTYPNTQQQSHIANTTEQFNELAVDLTSSDTNQAQPTSTSHKVPIRTHPMNLRTNPKPKTYLATKHPLPIVLHVSKTDIEPTCFSDANKFVHWRQAMSDEVNALIRNGTWTLMPKPHGANIVGNKWVFRIKRKADGTIDRYKARLVAKGYHQHDGIDYTDTFSPVVKATTIRIVLSLAISCNWTLKQLDVSNAFLHGNLNEEVYMSQPPGFIDENHPDYVCRLHKSLYGLKQAPREWFRRLSTFVCSLGFNGSTTDPSLFIYCVDSIRLYLLVYVDDIILTGNCSRSLSQFQAALQKEFNVRDLGDLHYFLGIEVIRTSDGIYLSQRKYLADLLIRTHMDGSKPVRSPMNLESLSKTMGSPIMNPEAYRQTLGALQYATLTRPDLAFCVNKLCQFMHSPTNVHWEALKRVLRYIKGTLDLSLWYQQNSTVTLNCYSDADWAGCPDDRKSTSGYLIFLGSNLISWCAKKQPTPARSSTESEYRAVANATAELIWIRSLLNELGITQTSPPVLWCDNIGATYLSANPLFKARTRHIEVDFHFVRDQVSKRLLSVQYVSTKDQLADLLTKPLPSPRFRLLVSKLHLHDRPSACEGVSTPSIPP